MLLRHVAAVVVISALLFAPAISSAQGHRGPSTAEERQQALEYIHEWQSNPLGPQAKDQFGWVLKLFADVPDMTVHVCMILDKLPKGEKKDSFTVFGGEFMGQAAFVIDNSDKRDDRLAEHQAGVEGALKVYELLLRVNPKDREPYLDDLIQRRDAGTLNEFVKERVTAACQN